MIDLHVHSTVSDGTVDPNQIPELAKNAGLQALALTDHDTTEGLEAFYNAGKLHNIETVPGVELSASWYHSSVHIVGLFIDPESTHLKQFLKSVIDQRHKRNERIIKKLSSLGFKITVADWIQEAGNNVPGRPHLASLLVKRGFFPDIKSVFSELIGNNAPGYEPRVQPRPEEAISIIHKAGGVAIWAHPYAMRLVPFSTLKKAGLTMKGYGLDGLETYYSHFTEEETKNAHRFAHQYNLLESGGSDYHGDNTPGVELGRGLGSLNVPYEVLEKIKRHLGIK